MSGSAQSSKNGEDLNAVNRRLATELEAANKELEAFSYSVSHDLRAPLRHILGYVELLKLSLGASLEEKPLHYLDQIAGSADQMQKLLGNLIDFSRIGRAEMHFKEIDLTALAQGAVAQLKQQTGSRKVIWKIGALPIVRGDAVMLTQVFIHLFANAVKFTRPCDPAEIEAGSLAGSDGEKTIFVRDNGVGFDMKFADRLFGVFQRLHLNDEFEGVGMGLASARRIIARHGGRTWAEGRPGLGATIYFSLPTVPA